MAETTMRQNAGESGAVTAVLPAGEEVDFIRLEKTANQKWCYISRANGEKGYVPGTTAVRALVQARLEQPAAELRVAPDPNAAVVRQLRKAEMLLLLQTVPGQGGNWVVVRGVDGQEGFLDGKARIKKEAVVRQNTPQHDMLVGGLWCVGGIVVTVLSYGSKGGIIAWGAIVFGGIQFFRGLIRLMSKS
jgi:hypothetical protein